MQNETVIQVTCHRSRFYRPKRKALWSLCTLGREGHCRGRVSRGGRDHESLEGGKNCADVMADHKHATTSDQVTGDVGAAVYQSKRALEGRDPTTSVCGLSGQHPTLGQRRRMHDGRNASAGRRQVRGPANEPERTLNVVMLHARRGDNRSDARRICMCSALSWKDAVPPKACAGCRDKHPTLGLRRRVHDGRNASAGRKQVRRPASRPKRTSNVVVFHARRGDNRSDARRI
jgi:hypothetical protein